MNVQHVYDEGLCMQCGTCEGVCPTGSVSLTWDLRVGYRLSVREQTCTDCGTCHAACPGLEGCLHEGRGHAARGSCVAHGRI